VRPAIFQFQEEENMILTEGTKKTIGRVGIGLAAAGAVVAIIFGVSADTVSGAVTTAIGIAAGIGALLAGFFKK